MARRRYAILDDNQLLLEERLEVLRRSLPPLLSERACAAIVIGSVAEGRARDSSDIDLLIVLRNEQPRREHYRWWEEQVTPAMGHLANRPFPVQPTFVARSALITSEPHLRQALAKGLPLWDPEGLFDDQPEARP